MELNKHEVIKQFEIDGFYTAFSFSWDSQFIFNGESHDFWEIIFLSDGKVEVTEDEKIYTLKPNNLIIHAPMEFHRIRSAGGTSPKGYIMTFHTTGMLPDELKNGIFLLEKEEMIEYTAIVKQIRAILRKRNDHVYASQEAASRLCAFLIHLGMGNHAQQETIVTPSAFEYRKAVSAMSENVCENISLSELAASCNISVSYLKLLFQKYAGISPKSYYSNLRIQHAIALMKCGKTASEIANIMNFSSPNYFSVFFQKQTGKPPSAYRKDLL